MHTRHLASASYFDPVLGRKDEKGGGTMSDDIRLYSKKKYLPKSAAKVQKYFGICKF